METVSYDDSFNKQTSDAAASRLLQIYASRDGENMKALRNVFDYHNLI